MMRVVAHCGCGFKEEANVDEMSSSSVQRAAEVVNRIIKHAHATGHTALFHGEVRSERKVIFAGSR